MCIKNDTLVWFYDRLEDASFIQTWDVVSYNSPRNVPATDEKRTTNLKHEITRQFH